MSPIFQIRQALARGRIVFRRPILTPRAFEGNVMKYFGNSRFDANSIGVEF